MSDFCLRLGILPEMPNNKKPPISVCLSWWFFDDNNKSCCLNARKKMSNMLTLEFYKRASHDTKMTYDYLIVSHFLLFSNGFTSLSQMESQ